MSALLRIASGSAYGILYAEDFTDAAPSPAIAVPPEPLPEPPAPSFTQDELDSAREEAAAEARSATLASAEAAALHRRTEALLLIGDGMTRLRDAASAEAAQHADALARTVLGLLCAALPSLIDGTARREISGLLHRLLPRLYGEKQVVVRLNPHLAEAVAHDLDGLDEALRGRVTLVPTDALAAGDLRVSWEEGRFDRDTHAIHQAARDILVASGLPEQEPPADA